MTKMATICGIYSINSDIRPSMHQMNSHWRILRSIRFAGCVLLFWLLVVPAYSQQPEVVPDEEEVQVEEGEAVEMGVEEIADELPVAEPPTAMNQQQRQLLGAIPQPSTTRPITSDQWEHAVQQTDYSSDLKVEKPKPPVRDTVQRQSSPPSNPFEGLGKWIEAQQVLLKWILGLLLFGLLAWMAYQYLQAPKNSLIRASDGTAITLENLEEYIHETDLQRFLREALSNNNYQQAVRIYFLQVIKTLSEKGAIRWSKEKTNHQYIREMSAHAQIGGFKHATLTYERVWYGEKPLQQADYQLIAADMDGLLASLG
jgi:hypothetical protein